MKRSNIIYVILPLLLLSSCSMFIGSEIGFEPERQSARLSSTYRPNADNKLNIQGYYLPYDPESRRFINGIGFILLYDGLVSDFDMFSCNSIDTVLMKISDEIIDSKTSLYSVRDCNSYGVFSISGDTLIIDRYSEDDNNFFHVYWRLKTDKYKIINSTTLEEIPTDSDYVENIRREFCGNRIYRFVPATAIQEEYLAPIKYEKWIWQSKDEWKAYRRRSKNLRSIWAHGRWY